MLNRAVARDPARFRLARPRISVNRISLGMGLCGLVAIVLVSGAIAWRERETYVREARSAAQTRAYALADHASRLFEVSNLALRTTVLEAGSRPWDEIETSRPLWEEMRATSDALPYVGDLWLNDATGRLRLTTAGFPTPDSNAKDRQAFRLVAAGDKGLVIGESFVGRITHAPTFFIARRLEGPDGAFRGMVSATADLGYFTSYWRSLDLAAGDHVALVRGIENEVLVRLPEVPPPASGSLAALAAAVRARPFAGSYAPAPDRFAYYHRVGELPLYLTVSFSGADVDHVWRRWLWGFALYPGVAILALALLMALSRRQSRIEARATREVIRARTLLASANRLLERRVAERTADLQESNAEVQRFAYIVSHDLRAPLLNITGFTSELQRMRGQIFAAPAGAPPPTALVEDFDEAIGFIQTSIGKMDRLINAILLLARQGSRVFAPESVDMAALMRSIADGVAHRAQAAGAQVKVTEPMPTLVIDRVAAEQVFSNLVDNAVKYLRPGVPGEVVISGATEAGRAVFAVADNGRGIEARDHVRVFELFRRSGPQDRAGEGIGLAHVRSLVRQLGGTISLASALGEGSTFTVVLPLVPEGAPD